MADPDGARSSPDHTGELPLAEAHWLRGEQEPAVEHGERGLEIAVARGDLALRVAAHLQIARAYQALGLFTTTLEHARAVIGLLEGRRATERFGPGGLPYASACGLGAEGLAELGDTVGALDLVHRGERVARTEHDAHGQAVVAAARAHVHLLREEGTEAIMILEPVVAACREQRFLHELARGLTALGRGLALVGRTAEGIEIAREAIRRHEEVGALVHRSHAYLTLAAACAEGGRLEEADEAAARAIDLSERHGERAWEAWTRFAMGGIAGRRADRRRAEARYDEAQEIAEELTMRPLLERCRAALRTLG